MTNQLPIDTKLFKELERSANYSHGACDGRFCKIEEHVEMLAVRRIKELLEENRKLKVIIHNGLGAEDLQR